MDEGSVTHPRRRAWWTLLALVATAAAVVASVGLATVRAGVDWLADPDRCWPRFGDDDGFGGRVFNASDVIVDVTLRPPDGRERQLVEVAPNEQAWVPSNGFDDTGGCGACNAVPMVARDRPTRDELGTLGVGRLCGNEFVWTVPGTTVETMDADLRPSAPATDRSEATNARHELLGIAK